MAAGSIDEGALPLGRDPALLPAPGAEGERRRHARLLGRWRLAKGERRMPVLGEAGPVEIDAADAGSALFELTDQGPVVLSVAARLRAEPEWPRALIGQLGDRLSAIAAQPAPLGFEAEVWDGARATWVRGILLPFADETGALRFVQAVLGWTTVAPFAAADAAIAGAEALAAATAPVDWLATPPAGTAEERLAVARIWAALAAADAGKRAVALHAALSATFDALLGLPGEVSARALVDDVFGAGFPSSLCRRLALALRHATRLGLGAGGLAPLLGRYPEGFASMATIELGLLRHERKAPADAAPAAHLQLRLVAIAADLIARPDRAAARDTGAATPWTILAA